MGVCGVAGVLALGHAEARRRRRGWVLAVRADRAGKEGWRMPPFGHLCTPALSIGRTVGRTALRACLLAAAILVAVRIVQLALGYWALWPAAPGVA